MIRRIVVLLFSALLAISCSEDEVVPRTNPRFSVAFVQTIDPTGVEFAANMYDYGSEEILEHGFVFSSSGPLNFETSEIVRASGSPGSEFRMKATHGMRVGETMIVAAFVKTESGVVYSQSYSFVSQGSAGFIFERVEVPSEVYYGDTIRVYAQSLPRAISQYSIKMQGNPAFVSKIEEDYFEFLIPRDLTFEEDVNVPDLFTTDLKIAGKTLSMDIPLDFKAPEFAVGEIQELDYTQDLVITGRYLGSKTTVVNYVDKGGEKTELEFSSATDDKIVVKLTSYFEEMRPQLEVIVRGKSTRLDGLLQLKETKILPGQKTTFHGSSGVFVLKGENFNPHSIEYNKLEFSQPFLRYWIHSLSAAEMEISYEYNGDELGYRTTDLYLKNGGVRSQNSFNVEWTAPAIPIIHFGQPDFDLVGRAASIGGKGYLISNRGIMEVDPVSRSYNKISESPVEGTDPVLRFALPAEGKVYFSSSASHEDSDEKRFYVFDPLTRKVTQLPSIPSEDNSFQSIVYHQGFLYYQGDKIERTTGYDGDIQRYRFDLARRAWEKLPSLSQHDGYYNYYTTFEWKDEIYSVSPVAFDDATRYGTGVFKFNKSEYTWDLQRFYEGRGPSSDANQAIVVADKVYLKGTYDFWEIDLNTWAVSMPEYLNERYNFVYQNTGFFSGGKFYFADWFRILEFDTKYFY